MKKLICGFFALAAGAGSLFAQTFTGTWQGALKIAQARNGELRIVMKISTTEKDSLKAELYSIDQSGTVIPAESVKVNGQGIKIAIPAMNLSYEGSLNTEGNTITGTWSQGQPLPLVLVKATPTTAWTIPDPPPPPRMMDAKAKPEFEVATIKPSDPNRPGFGIGINQSGMLTTLNTSLSDLLKFAYSVHPKQVIGLPAWAESEKFDLSAKPNTPGIPSLPQMREMLQKLIEDRFSLAFHREKKELTAYTITIAKGGEKIKKTANAQAPLPGFGGRPQTGFVTNNATMAEFATVLQAQFMDQPVVDQTGLGDTRYSFTLKFTPDPSQSTAFGGGPNPNTAPPPPDADAPPDIFAALQLQAGLEMKKTKAQVDVMAIDKVQKPGEN